MLEIKVLENGNLELSIPSIDDQTDVLEQLADRNESTVYNDLLEPFFTNGSYHNISPDQFYVGLTSDPYILAENVTYEDDGSVLVEGGMWHYNDYMIKSLVEKIAMGEKVIMQKFAQYDKPETLDRV